MTEGSIWNLNKIIPGVPGIGRPDSSFGRRRGKRAEDLSHSDAGRWKRGAGALGLPFRRKADERAVENVSRRMRMDRALSSAIKVSVSHDYVNEN